MVEIQTFIADVLFFIKTDLLANITDPKTGKNAHIVSHDVIHDECDHCNALVVATHPLKQYENSINPTNI